MSNCFFKPKAEDFPSRPGEYIHKRDEREEQVPIFKYRQSSTPTLDEITTKIKTSDTNSDTKEKKTESETNFTKN